MLDYITEKFGVLSDLRILNYCTAEERQTLEDCQSEIKADNISRGLINKYYDIMLADYEASKQDEEPEIEIDEDSILESSLSKRTKNALMRNHITNFSMFYDFVKLYGWNKIKCFGEKCAKEVFMFITEPEDVDNAVQKYKYN